MTDVKSPAPAPAAAPAGAGAAPAAGGSGSGSGSNACVPLACQCWGSRWWRSFMASVDTKGGLDKCFRTAAYGTRLLEAVLDRWVLQPQLIAQRLASEAYHKAQATAAAAAGKPAPAPVPGLTGSTTALQNFLAKARAVESGLSGVRRGTRLPGLPGQWKAVLESARDKTLIGRLNTLKGAAMIPYYPLDNIYWLLKVGAMTGPDMTLVARASCLFWALSLLFALAVNFLRLRAAYRLMTALNALRRAQTTVVTAAPAPADGAADAAAPAAAAGAGSGASAAAALDAAAADAAILKRFVAACARAYPHRAQPVDPLLLAALQKSGLRTPESVSAVRQALAACARDCAEQWLDAVKNGTDMVVAVSETYFDWSRLTTGFFGTIASAIGWYVAWPPPPKS